MRIISHDPRNLFVPCLPLQPQGLPHRPHCPLESQYRLQAPDFKKLHLKNDNIESTTTCVRTVASLGTSTGSVPKRRPSPLPFMLLKLIHQNLQPPSRKTKVPNPKWGYEIGHYNRPFGNLHPTNQFVLSVKCRKSFFPTSKK